MSVAARTVHLSVDPARHRDLVTATVELTAGGAPLTLHLTVPAGETTVEELLPVLQGLTGLFIGRGVAAVEQAGKAVSCRAGCGACCRQMVPISGAEARRLARLVAAMPPARRAAVRARFAAAIDRLAAAGLLDRLRDPATIVLREHGMAYFRLGIPCPFLEDESCSIHPDRPLVCREYLVTSPAENCTGRTGGGIAMVPLAWDVSRSVNRMAAAQGWTPLVLALERAKRAPAPPRLTGPEILAALFAAPRD